MLLPSPFFLILVVFVIAKVNQSLQMIVGFAVFHVLSGLQAAQISRKIPVDCVRYSPPTALVSDHRSARKCAFFNSIRF